MRYMMFIKHSEEHRKQGPPAGLREAMGKFVSESLANGTMVDAAGLRETAHGSRVRLSGGKITVTDGPFTEAKEMVGGYAIVEAKSKKEALDIATRFMDLHRQYWPEFEGECEVRPFEQPGEAVENR